VTVARDVPQDMTFEFYPNKQATRQPRFLQKSRFLLSFNDSVAGPSAGSSVVFRGIRLDGILGGLSETLDEIQKLAGVANEDLVPGPSSSLARFEETLSSADAMISPESAMAQELEQLVVDLSEAARSIRLLTERLQEHPEELPRGKRE
jgi:hypothetical protein